MGSDATESRCANPRPIHQQRGVWAAKTIDVLSAVQAGICAAPPGEEAGAAVPQKQKLRRRATQKAVPVARENIAVAAIVPEVELCLLDDRVPSHTKISVTHNKVPFAFKFVPVGSEGSEGSEGESGPAEAAAANGASSDSGGKVGKGGTDEAQALVLMLVEIYEGGRLVNALLCSVRVDEGWEDKVRDFVEQDTGRPAVGESRYRGGLGLRMARCDQA